MARPPYPVTAAPINRPPFSPASTTFFERLVARSNAERHPISATFEITPRCNLRCVHCYLGTKAGSHCAVGIQAGKRRPELTTAEACLILDKIAAAGCLWILLTGGEVLLRPDFPRIYRHARQLGMAVRVFTNGTLITGEIVELFREYRPLEVEISLYGSTPEMFRAVTGSKRGYAQSMRGIGLLLASGIRVKLKTVVMRQTQPGLARMKHFAEELGVPFRFDTVILPTRDGGRDPLAFRLPPEEAARIERDFRPAKPAPPPRRAQPQAGEDGLFLCGAARRSFMVDSIGQMRPCTLVQGNRYDLLHGTFEEGWRSMAPLCEIKKEKGAPCPGCPAAAVCRPCPALFEMETGNMHQPPAWLCQLAEHRRQATTD